MSSYILSDQGANFLSELVLEICKSVANQKKVILRATHPQTNGMVEKFNSTLIGKVSKVAGSSGKDILGSSPIPFLLFAYHTVIHDSTRESPF